MEGNDIEPLPSLISPSISSRSPRKRDVRSSLLVAAGFRGQPSPGWAATGGALHLSNKSGRLRKRR